MSILEVEDLCVRYGKATAVDRLTIRAEPGTTTVLVGPNGAGKSSVMFSIAGAVVASGDIRIDGRSITGLSTADRARSSLGFVPQGRQIFRTLSVQENLQIQADLLGLAPAAVIAAMERFPVLADRRDRLAGVLSGGEQQMLVVTRALMAEPSIILFDELMTGLAPKIVQDLARLVKDLARQGRTVLLAEPSIHNVRPVIDRGYVMLRGRVVEESEDGGEGLDELYRTVMTGRRERVEHESSRSQIQQTRGG